MAEELLSEARELRVKIAEITQLGYAIMEMIAEGQPQQKEAATNVDPYGKTNWNPWIPDFKLWNMPFGRVTGLGQAAALDKKIDQHNQQTWKTRGIGSPLTNRGSTYTRNGKSFNVSLPRQNYNSTSTRNNLKRVNPAVVMDTFDAMSKDPVASQQPYPKIRPAEEGEVNSSLDIPYDEWVRKLTGINSPAKREIILTEVATPSALLHETGHSVDLYDKSHDKAYRADTNKPVTEDVGWDVGERLRQQMHPENQPDDAIFREHRRRGLGSYMDPKDRKSNVPVVNDAEVPNPIYLGRFAEDSKGQNTLQGQPRNTPPSWQEDVNKLIIERSKNDTPPPHLDDDPWDPALQGR